MIEGMIIWLANMIMAFIIGYSWKRCYQACEKIRSESWAEQCDYLKEWARNLAEIEVYNHDLSGALLKEKHELRSLIGINREMLQILKEILEEAEAPIQFKLPEQAQYLEPQTQDRPP